MATPTDIVCLNEQLVVEPTNDFPVTINTENYFLGIVRIVSLSITQVGINDIIMFKDAIPLEQGSDTFYLVEQKNCFLKSTASLP